MQMNKILLALVAAGFVVAAPAQAATAKNVILMISDGQGFNTVKATDFFTGSQGVYESFAVKGSMNTSSAGAKGGYVGAAYDPANMWSNFNYQLSGATDSASAATAMYTGVKNYDNQINKTTSGANLTTFFETAANQGKATGAISTVNFDHATPAAVASHTTNRNDYTTITSQMIGSKLDVIMGAGNPGYNNNGQVVAANYSVVGNQANWNAITSGTNGRTFIDSKSQFEALANGTLVTDKVFGVAQARDTLQANRSGSGMGNLNMNVPSLLTMTQGALNVLGRDADGFAVMIEGGAVDWTNHANALGRTIEEQIDFNQSVQAVSDYLDAGINGNTWENTLLIVTSDHETGGLWGPTMGSFNQIVDNGVGNLPGAAYNTGGHTVGLVPFYAKGAGSELFGQYLTGYDANVAGQYGIDSAFNKYIDNTNVFNVMTAAVPEPESYAMLLAGLGMIGFMARRSAKK